jgi:hypothetical protein
MSGAGYAGAAGLGAVTALIGTLYALNQTGPTGDPGLLALDFLIEDEGHLEFVVDEVAPYFRSGDGFYLVRHAVPGMPCEPITTMNDYAERLNASFPGAPMAAQNACENIDDLATGDNGSCPLDQVLIPMLSMDYEPGDKSCFVKTQKGTLAVLQKFATTAHAHGFHALGYLTGQGLGHLRWDYGELATAVDWMTVETQAHVAAGAGRHAMQELASQYTKAQVSTAGLEGQATCAATIHHKPWNLGYVVDAMGAAQLFGCTRWAFEWGTEGTSGQEQLLQVLEAVRPRVTG